MNKTGVALPLFGTALETNPQIEQFWLRYIDAPIKDPRLENAGQVFERSEERGVAAKKLNVV